MLDLDTLLGVLTNLRVPFKASIIKLVYRMVDQYQDEIERRAKKAKREPIEYILDTVMYRPPRRDDDLAIKTGAREYRVAQPERIRQGGSRR